MNTNQEEQTRLLRIVASPIRGEIALLKAGGIAVGLLFIVGISFTFLTGVKFHEASKEEVAFRRSLASWVRLFSGQSAADLRDLGDRRHRLRSVELGQPRRDLEPGHQQRREVGPNIQPNRKDR